VTVFKTEWRIEGQDAEGNWHSLDLAPPLGVEGDHLAHRDHVVKLLREHGIKRYSHVRLAKYVTTIEIVGEDIRV
jgi:hypothetical protein